MKVLLLQDVPNLGTTGEVYRVAGGYARNYLMPRNMAVMATAGAMRQADQIKEAGMRRRAQEKANAEAQAAMVNGKQLLFNANAGENDRLYGSVTASDIAEKLGAAVGFEIDRRRIYMDAALRELGIFPLELRFMADVVGKFQVAVARDGETWADAEARQAQRAAATMVQQAQASAAPATESVAEAAAEQE